MSDPLVITWHGRLVITTAQAAERLGVTAGTVRVRAHRHQVSPATHLDPRTPLWHPEDLGIEEQS